VGADEGVLGDLLGIGVVAQMASAIENIFAR
jgi:hypothetical protein